LIFFLLTVPKKPSQNNPTLPFSPSPTLNKLQLQEKKITLTPTLIPPAFTGAEKDPQIPQEELDLSIQKYHLRKITPLKENGFSIFFDYSTDKFNVLLDEPKDIAQASFSAWLKENYPALSTNTLIIK